MADSYFKKFQQIYYITRVGNEEQLKVLTDITTNVRLRKKILQNITAYEFYNLKQFETIENLAEKLYGDPNMHWIIMLVNDRYDYVNDFPLEQDAFDAMITANYASPDATKWHKLDGLVVDSTVAGATAQTHRQYEQERNEAKRRIKIITPALANQVVQEFKKMEI
jgi:hypothetical protein|tara:strand:+ start:17388 stop:17885 length:498 start_codon:yes stop_codon:yes gene_type:complete